MSRVFLGILAVLFIATGAVYLAAPMLIMGPMGFTGLSPAALTDVRATYGGLQLGLGVFLAVSIRSRVRTGLWAAFSAVAGIAACRSVGLTVDGEPTVILVGTVVFEWALAAAIAAVLLLTRRGRS